MIALFKRLLGEGRERQAMVPLYNRIIAHARDPFWYTDGAVPDNVTGRFDMVASVMALVLLRLEREESAGTANALLTELFIQDMDGQLREFGVGDVVVGKRMTQLMGQLGGRLAGLREALPEGGDMAGYVARNIHREEAVPDGAADAIALRLRALHTAIEAEPLPVLLTGGGAW